jgi:small multidrug resistance pump
MHFLYLGVAIRAEVTATRLMKVSDGFKRVGSTAATIVSFCVALVFLSLTLGAIPTGVAYAIWSGAGVVLIATIAWLFQGRRLDAPAMLGVSLIAAS